jgi:SAM-dependent methyltransferase
VTSLRANQSDLQRTGAYYDAFADVSEERYLANHVVVRVREAFRRIAERYPADAVLDVGCGPGTDLAWFMERYPARRYAGLDVSRRMVALARGRFERSGARIERGCAEDIPRVFPDERFDLVYSFFGPLNTEPELSRAVEALAGAVVPGGVLVLTFVNRAYLVDAALNLLRGRLSRALARFANRWRGYSHEKDLDARLYFPWQIERRFAPAFRVEKREGFSILYPSWYRAARFHPQGSLLRVLAAADRALNHTPFWCAGEHLLYVMRRSGA